MTFPDSDASHIPKSLAGDIVGATRPMHAKINKLITSRLPLALPPRVSHAGPYVSGLLHLLPVYTAFEDLWLDIIHAPPVEDATDRSVSHESGGNPPSQGEAGRDERPAVSERVHTILKSIYVAQLFRSDRLRDDIKSMTGWSDDVLDGQIHMIRGTGQLSAFISHIRQAVRARPHILIAYSYNLFMALFAGGRFIRASFENVEGEFWEAVPAPIKPTMQPCEPRSAATSSSPERGDDRDDDRDDDRAPEHTSGAEPRPKAQRSLPLKFWRFDTDRDGEDLKQEYKERLLRWEGELSAEERNDVVQESVSILESIGSLVGQLDAIFSDEQDQEPDVQIPIRPSLAGLFGQTQFGARLRDSLLVARERGVGNPSRSQSLDAAGDEKSEHAPRHEGDDGDGVAMGVEPRLGPPKSMRFAKSLPIPPRRHGRLAAAGIGGSSSSTSPERSRKHQASAAMMRPVLVAVFGLVLLYAWFTRVKAILS
ncbi:hypothetical protein Trco_001316 [Trichoderma cornu-damae]|uniref:Heme oxygenase-like protein n=1 Tax=Trichoderma cornu-damae TaxID=654480 RepID=A0A9P8QTR6_9HYPO|nr:hypothetical protein Trco_001316 [Trichoderma cornu-damae]